MLKKIVLVSMMIYAAISLHFSGSATACAAGADQNFCLMLPAITRISKAECVIDFSTGESDAGSDEPLAQVSAAYTFFNRASAQTYPIGLYYNGEAVGDAITLECNGESLTSEMIYVPRDSFNINNGIESAIALSREKITGFGERTGYLYSFNLDDLANGSVMVFEFDMDTDSKIVYYGSSGYNYKEDTDTVHMRVDFQKPETNDSVSVFIIGNDINNAETYLYTKLGLKRGFNFSSCTKTKMKINDFLLRSDGDEATEGRFFASVTGLDDFLKGNTYGALEGSFAQKTYASYLVLNVYNTELSMQFNELILKYQAGCYSYDSYYDPPIYEYHISTGYGEGRSLYFGTQITLFPPADNSYILYSSLELTQEQDNSYRYEEKGQYIGQISFKLCASEQPVDLGHPTMDCSRGNGSGLLALLAVSAYVIILAAICSINVLGIIVVFIVLKQKKRKQ
ncbi:MAG: hypothetical protein PHI19_03360 [Clostridia bacterium]|nr:hypothetical protein [Clostridia bacterium]